MATAFLELWRRRDTVRVIEGPVLPWLLVTTTNAARNSGRESLRYRKLLSSLQRSEQSLYSRIPGSTKKTRWRCL